MSARTLVIGAGGFLGGHVAAAADSRFEILPATRSGQEWTVDIEDSASVAALFSKTRPQIVILTAAMADIDRCQREPEQARRANVLGAWHVATECARAGARLVFASSGSVFDGRNAVYREDSPTCPLNVYGASKVMAETVVMGVLPAAAITRLSLLLGFPVRPGTNALLDKLRRAFQAGENVAVTAKESRNAIDVETAARWMLDLAVAPGARGIFHLGSSDALPRYEIVRGVAEAMGYPVELVTLNDRPQPGRAPRGRCELLVPGRIREFSAVPPPECRQAIERCVHAVA